MAESGNSGKCYRTERTENMYYVPDGTTKCGYYECEVCGYRFLDLATDPEIECPDCAADFDPEIGPDEEMAAGTKSAKLISVCQGEEVEKMDALLSLAITGGNYDWI
jgi:hypothetical protein